MNNQLELIIAEVKSMIEKGIGEEEVVRYISTQEMSLGEMVRVTINAYNVGLREAENKLCRIEELRREIAICRNLWCDVLDQMKKEEEAGECD